VELQLLLGVYSDPKRDPRGHTATVAYIARARGVPRAADDAKHLEVFEIDALPSPLAFDHANVLADYRHYRHTGKIPPPRP
jgi:8-oxo-dGTP diphosphatase